MHYPYIRKAITNDYDAIWLIWMQDHIIQWMSFSKKSKQDFVANYEHMLNTSDIYVMIDNIDGIEKVVGVRRIKFGQGHHQHIAEYCSMGISKDCQGKGYAKIFYEEFEKIAQEQGMMRIQLTQSGGNERAFHLADQAGFKEEAIFPDWLKRNKNNSTYHLIERYVYKIINQELSEKVAQIPSLKYQEKIPELTQVENSSIAIKRVGDQFVCYLENKPILTIILKPDHSVIKHVGFLSIELSSPPHQAQALIGLNKILSEILKEEVVKKVDLLTPDPLVADLCRNQGFFVRGEKIASYFDGKDFKNELALEYSFFSIQDAKDLIKAGIPDEYKIKSIDHTLMKCAKKIKDLLKENKIAELGAAYLENLIYQMVRDELGENKLFSLADKKWILLLADTPKELHHVLLVLYNSLQICHGYFFKNESRDLLFELPASHSKLKKTRS